MGSVKTRTGFVTLIGRPNVGKSTLMNHMIGQKIAITSAKPQTTRNRIQTVYTEERGQAIFLDTPGIHKAKNKLGEYMVAVATKTISEVDLILWLIEPSTYIGEEERAIAKTLSLQKAPVVLVINKVDTVKKEAVMQIMETYKHLLHFADVVPVAALKDVNVTTLLDTIFKFLPEGPMYYDEETVTDQPMRQIAAEIIREKALRLLSDEIPHGIAVEIDSMKERKNGSGLWDVDATIVCERDSHKGIVIGKGGAMLKKIGTQARGDIEQMMDAQINLKLWVKVRKEWRDNDLQLNNLGYRKKDIK